MMEHMKDPGWQYLRQTDDQRLADQSKPYDSKKSCWVPDEEEGYLCAEITKDSGDTVTVTSTRGSTEVKKDLIQEMNPPKFEKTEDMSNLSFLNDASVLWNLRSRYAAMLIYTYSGLFCVVINPYKRLPIYTDSVARMYMGKRKTEMPPHLFAVSDEAYRNMLQDRINQSMLITGESGAGKTENTKKVISYFASVGASQAGPQAEPEPGKKKVTLEDQIVQTNPVLEAFGNAKTVRNNNSSRFGKFIRIHFSKEGKVAGCDIENYLLEKSRVIRQAPGERCYHIFYQLYHSPDPNMRKELQITQDISEYRFVNQAELSIVGVDDVEECQMTDEAFDILNFSHEEKWCVFKLMAAQMHMGQMKFKQRPREEQAEPDGDEGAKNVCAMYGVDTEDYLKALCKPRVKVGTEWVNKGQNLEQVNWAIGAMAKGTYARVFDFLVQMCNKTLDAKALKREHFIGVLDIAGFEIFDFNSFEQLWINFVNEKLQQFFNHHMFVLEQEEYKVEGIEWTFIDFGLDLAACIELIEKPMGIISMLDEECIVPKATDLTYAGKLTDKHLGKHPSFQKPKPPKGNQAEAHFALGHYAGCVRYNVMNWLEKNKDPLNDSVITVMKASKGNPVLVHIWRDFITQEEQAKAPKGAGGKKKGKSASMMTVSMLYRESLNKLMDMLHTTHPSFVRCLIPNEQKKCGLLEAALVMNQLTCNGVLEGIRICRKGFPNRTLHPDFRIRYSLLAADAAKSSTDMKVCSDAILAEIVKRGDLDAENFRVGKTKVFFKAGILARMEDLRDERLTVIMTGMQSWIRWGCGLTDRKRRHGQIAGRTVCTRNIKKWIKLRTWEWFLLLGRAKEYALSSAGALQLEKLNDDFKEMEKGLIKEETLRNQLTEQNAKIEAEKKELMDQLQKEQGDIVEQEQKFQRVTAQKEELEKACDKMNGDLTSAESQNETLLKQKKDLEGEAENVKKSIQESEMALRKAESEKQSREMNIRSLQDEMAQQDEMIAKLNKEKKHQEEIQRKTNEDLTAEEEKVNHLNKIKGKLESSLDEMEDALEREKRAKADTDKLRRKTEGEAKVAQENIDEITKQKNDIEQSLRKKEGELMSASSRLDDEQMSVSKVQKGLKELQSRINEMEEELEGERSARTKAEKAKSDLQHDMEELQERLDEAGGATTAQQEMNKKREAELSKLRRDLEEANQNHEGQLSSLRKKHNDAIAEMGDQLDQLNKQKARMDKEKFTLQREIEDLHSLVDQETKAKTNVEKQSKTLESQLSELQAKVDDQSRSILDATSSKGRLQNENADLTRQMEDAEAQLASLNRIKSQLVIQLDEAKKAADDEARERSSLSAQARNYQHEADTLREQMEEELEAKSELQRHISKAHAEIAQWKSKFESEGLARAEELEEAKRKLQQKVNEMQESVDAANQRISSLDKTRMKLMGELDDAQVDVERANSYASQLEKKQKTFDKTIEDWKKKCDDIAVELDNSQRESRHLSTEVFKLRNHNDEMHEQVEAIRRENKNLQVEIRDLTDQLSEGGRTVHEMQKMVRRFEMEKEELQQALDEAEAALEAEESKVLRAQVEVAQIRSEIEKRIQEKEEEFENTRKNHVRAIESMQASLETEAKGRAELLRVKKKLEGDINELEIALDHSNKANADAQKSIRRYIEQVKELQMQVEEEQRQRDELRESLNNSERRCTLLQSEKDEIVAQLSNAERAKRTVELEAHEMREQYNEAVSSNNSLAGTKRTLEAEIQVCHAELDDCLTELKQSDERAKRAMGDAARLAEELKTEQDHSVHSESMRKGMEQTVKELQARLDDAEKAALAGGKKLVAKLELRARELEQELDTEQRRHAEALKAIAKNDRRVRELQFQVDEEKKNQARMNDLVEKLQLKIKAYKRQVEEAEDLANSNLSKYRQLQNMLQDAEDRADLAETSLQKLRAKSRVGGTPLVQSSSFMARSSSQANLANPE